jgi:hypothetical protein
MPVNKVAQKRSFANRQGFIAKHGGAPAKPVNTVVPTIAGTARVGVTLTGSNGTWTGRPTPKFLRQWLANGVEIPGAVGATYVPVAGDLGKTIVFRVTGVSISGSVAKSSVATAAVIAA